MENFNSESFVVKIIRNNSSKMICIPREICEISNLDFGDLIKVKILDLIKKVDKKKEEKKNGR